MGTRILYLDDEVHQHISLEVLIPEEWEIHCFADPLKALDALSEIDPWIIISDQRMPHMQGFRFLELAKTMTPDAIRVITTGYSDEKSIVESIRKAQVFDYIVKPWDTNKLLKSLERAAHFYESEKEKKELNQRLQRKNKELKDLCDQLGSLVRSHEKIEEELKSWVHPFVMQAAAVNIHFPIQKDIAALVIDIIGSSEIHEKITDNMPLRIRVLQTAWEIILRHGGEVESQEGDKIYANFGLFDLVKHPANAALAAAKELRSSLQSLNDHYGTSVECGVAVHVANKCSVFLRKAVLNTESGVKVRKKFDTSSLDIDLTHRLEDITHQLPGSNIMLTRDLFDYLERPPDKNQITSLGHYVLKGQLQPAELLLIKSNRVTQEEIEELKSNYLSQFSLEKKVA